jgi:CspA family cold shock protein
MTVGVIKTKTDKGFGFIAVEGSDDVFFHGSACNGQFDVLEVGQTVQFDMEKGEKGLKAANVVAVKAGAAPKAAEQAPAAPAADLAA